ncbi:hypothetical protein GCM10009775_18790 [Microbacterium aoyamense]|uniref:Uncharacterized protein n=1 Tax=Microbacterium aoyamense TaxID=344166 RepID=A0ABP5B215_9MICO|nr:hypothetical protein [Microbacterium aoyamense]
MISVRNILSGLAVAFSLYLAARGLSWGEDAPRYPLIIVAAFALYLVTTTLCTFWQPRKPDRPTHPAPRQSRLPRTAGILAIATAAIVPTAISYSAGPGSYTASYATWYLGGIGALMTIVMARRRPWMAWSGTALLAIGSIAWMGLDALTLGLIGSIVWVFVAQLLVLSLDRAARDTSQLANLQTAASAWQASQVVRQRERRVQVQEALAIAGPVLTRTVANRGVLDDADRLEARIAEGRLRDELRGPRLLDDAVRAQLELARRRGATVTVLDEGGLDGMDEASLAVIRAELAETLRTSESNRLYIRTAPHDSVAVTVVGRSESDGGLSDEDAVDLWREIVRPTN